MDIHVGALIPAFNCEDRIGAVVSGTAAQGLDVLVVDDGSTDATATAARQAGARLVRRRENGGKGDALRVGLSVLLGEPYTHILMLDGDGQHDPADIPRFLAMAGEADFLLGNRLWNREAIPAKRFWTNYIGTRALELMSGYPLEDSQCGFRMLAAGLLRRMGLVGRRYSVDTEIMVRAGKLRASFEHVPVRVIYDGGPSHFRPVRDTLHIVFSSARFKVDEGDLRNDPGPDLWRRMVAAVEVLPPLEG